MSFINGRGTFSETFTDLEKPKGHHGSVRKRGRKEKPEMASTWRQMYKAWPMCTILIVANEFFQKFASLGTVLTLYLMNGLRLSENQTYIFFNLYSVFGGIFPLLGSILADGYIGKFRTILYATFFYGVGKLVMTGSSIFPPEHYIHPWGDLLGIIIIIIGMGGIIPCVASFGGDQFEPHQERMISIFFSMFYAAINAGAMISTIFYPILRSRSCMGQDSCFPLSFAVSAFFMIFSSILFVVGSKSYKKQPPKGNVFGDVISTTKAALRNKRNADAGTRKQHWLDYYFDTHDCRISEKCLALQKKRRDPSFCERKRFIDDIKALLRILVMYLPIPMFWALYDQQYSVWLVQSIQMDCRLWGDILFLPDQMQFINPVLILVFIALFESIVYPMCSKFFKLTPLKKMVAGGVVASMAFVVSAIVQLKVNTTLPELPEPNYSFVSIVNTFDNCDVNVTVAETNDYRFVSSHTSLTNNKLSSRKELFEVKSGKVTFGFTYNGTECNSIVSQLPNTATYEVNSEKIHYIYVGKLGAFANEADHKKPTLGTGEFSLSLNLAFAKDSPLRNMALCRRPTADLSIVIDNPCNPQHGEDFYFFNVSTAILQPYSGAVDTSNNAALFKFRPIRPGTWQLFYVNTNAEEVVSKTIDATQINVTATSIVMDNHAQGGVYVLLLTGSSDQPEKRIFQVVPDNSVSILWQIPQIAVITAAEILFSVTGYEFSYSQSGKSMKSLVQALWFLTVSAGDLVIVFVALVDFKDLVMQSLIYAGAMLVVIIIFALLAIFYYEYRDNSDDEDDDLFDDYEEDELEDYSDQKTRAVLPPPSYGATAPPNDVYSDNGLKNRHVTNNKYDYDNLGYDTKSDSDPWNPKL